jgi:hypothetical protein
LALSEISSAQSQQNCAVYARILATANTAAGQRPITAAQALSDDPAAVADVGTSDATVLTVRKRPQPANDKGGGDSAA